MSSERSIRITVDNHNIPEVWVVDASVTRLFLLLREIGRLCQTKRLCQNISPLQMTIPGASVQIYENHGLR